MTPPTKLANRNFLLLWQGLAVSQIGSQLSTVAVLFWLKHATESPILMGSMAMLSGLIAVAAGPFAGAFADRYSRRSIIITCDLTSAITVLALAGLMFIPAAGSGALLAAVFFFSIMVSAIHSFITPAISASTPDLVPTDKVVGANSMMQASTRLATLVGLGIGGMLYRTLGAPLVLLIDGITYLFSAFSASFIQIPQKLADGAGSVTSRAGNLKQEILEGFRYVRADKGLSQLLLVATTLNFLIAPMLGLFPFFVEDHLKLNPGWYGYLLAFYGAGNLLGFLIAGTVKVSSSARASTVVGFMLLASVLYGLLGVASAAWMAATLVAGIGVSSGFMNVNIWSILQVTTPSDIRGRVFGLLQTVAACLLPIGMGLAGLAASLLGKNIALIYIVCGICMGLVTLVASLLDDFRRYLSFDAKKTAEAVSADEVPTLEHRIHEGIGAD